MVELVRCENINSCGILNEALKRNCWRHVITFGTRHRRAAGLNNIAGPLIVGVLV